MENIKDINIKNRTYYFFDDIINIKIFYPNLLKIDKKSYKIIEICHIGYITLKYSDYVQINSVNPLYLIIGEADEHIEESNEYKYLIFDSTDKNKEVLIKYAKLWDRIKNFIQKVNNKIGKYGKEFMKIKFNCYDNLLLIKTLKIHNMTIVIGSVFQEDGKYYPQVFLDG